jgi:chalcone isomerase-like protein
VRVNVPAILAAATTWCVLASSVPRLHARELAGTTMPEIVRVGGRVLALNGMGIGKKLFVRVYVIGLYLERKATDAQSAIKSEEGKRIALIMLRDVSRRQFVEAVEKGMIRNSGVPMPSLRARLDLLEHALPALKKGDVLDFTYLPGVGTLVRGQQRELKIVGKDFADALLSVWLGPRADSGTLHHDLLAGH